MINETFPANFIKIRVGEDLFHFWWCPSLQQNFKKYLPQQNFENVVVGFLFQGQSELLLPNVLKYTPEHVLSGPFFSL